MKQCTNVILLLLWIQVGYAISPTNVIHEPNSIFYVNPSAGEIKLKTQSDELTEAYVVTDSERRKMEITYRSDNFVYFTANLNSFDTTMAYHFVLKDTLDSLRHPRTDKIRPEVPVFRTPAWALGKTYYSIFTDGFYNASMSNNPEETIPWNSIPTEWLPYGGDLRGIIQKLSYIDALDPDIIILQPIFSASSNHKLNPRDYATLDVSFGDTFDLKNLIEEIHNKNRKIILSIICTHTGTDFSPFEDVVQNGNASIYADWFFMKSTTIETMPSNYECWLSDSRFPKINLRNTEVQNFFLGNLEYWHHFGFDGFYIGEGQPIDSTFIKMVRRSLKSKHPDFLLLGSDMRLLSGNGFDGVLNKDLTDIVMDYFVENMITTSDFDREIRRILFFNPPQVNSINLVNLSNHSTRINNEAQADIIKNLYAFIFTCVGSPVILYGDEIGMSDCAPCNPGSFTWNSEEQNRDLFELVKKLTAIRKRNPQVSSNNFFTLYVNDITKVYAYDRGGLIVVLNSGDKQSFVELPAWDGIYRDLITDETLTAYSQKLKFSINPKHFRILKREI